jgi:hypothetical protein
VWSLCRTFYRYKPKKVVMSKKSKVGSSAAWRLDHTWVNALLEADSRHREAILAGMLLDMFNDFACPYYIKHFREGPKDSAAVRFSFAVRLASAVLSANYLSFAPTTPLFPDVLLRVCRFLDNVWLPALTYTQGPGSLPDREEALSRAIGCALRKDRYAVCKTKPDGSRYFWAGFDNFVPSNPLGFNFRLFDDFTSLLQAAAGDGAGDLQISVAQISLGRGEQLSLARFQDETDYELSAPFCVISWL